MDKIAQFMLATLSRIELLFILPTSSFGEHKDEIALFQSFGEHKDEIAPFQGREYSICATSH